MAKVNWAEVEKKQAEAKKAEADAKAASAKAAADAAASKAKAEADAASAKVRLAEIEAQGRKDAADRQEREAAAARKAEADKNSVTGTVTGLVKQYAPSVLMAVAAVVAARAIGSRAAAAAVKQVAEVEKLGGQAAKLLKAKTPLVGTPAGDQIKGIVADAGRRGAPHFAQIGKTPGSANAAAVALAVEGTVTTAVGMGADKAAGFDLGLSEEARSTMRTVGLGSLAGSAAMKSTLALAKAAAPRPSAKATQAITAAGERIAREEAAGAAKAGAARIGATVARAEQETAAVVASGKLDAAVAAVKGRTKVAVAKQAGDTATVLAVVKGNSRVAAGKLDAALAAVDGKTGVAVARQRGVAAERVAAARASGRVAAVKTANALAGVTSDAAIAAALKTGKAAERVAAVKGAAKVAAAKGRLRPAQSVPATPAPVSPPASPAAQQQRGIERMLADMTPGARRQTAAPRARSTGSTYTRTYKSGPKAGQTETVRKSR